MAVLAPPALKRLRSHGGVDDGTTAFVLLDVSGSMAGARLSAARAACSACFAAMRDEDRFAVVTFDSRAFFRLKPRSVGQLRRQNELPGILERVFPRGSTALFDAIFLTVGQIRNKDVPSTVTVLTDGEDNASTHALADVLALLAGYPNISLDIVHIGSSSSSTSTSGSGTGNGGSGSGGSGRVPAYEALVAKRGTYVVVRTVEVIVQTTTELFVRAYGNGRSESLTR